MGTPNSHLRNGKVQRVLLFYTIGNSAGYTVPGTSASDEERKIGIIDIQLRKDIFPA